MHGRRLMALAVLCTLLPLLVSGAEANRTTEPFRLSRSVVPSHYDLYIETFLGDDAGVFKFEGNVDITLHTTEPGVKEIRLHVKELEVQEADAKVTAQDETIKAPAVSHVRLEPSLDFLVLQLDAALKPHVNYHLKLAFGAPLGKALAGYYRSTYQTRSTNETRWMSVTQFEATDARRAFPCFDEPSFKATFSISLAHHQKYWGLSNMPQESSEPLAGRKGWVVEHFQRSVPMSTYVVAFMVGDLSHTDSRTADNTTLFRVWAQRELLGQTHYAALVGPRVLSFYEHFFQVAYPLPKQDMVAIPDFSAGAMENWGLITYRERLLLFDQETSSVLSKRDVASVVAHELAHQWFGNLVTMRWWTDLWLNEGFATYVATLGTNSVHPNWKSLEGDALTNMLTVFKFDALETSHTLSVMIKHPSEIAQIFDSISYKKGSFLIRMMSNFLGEDVFRAGLTNYLRKHQLNNAEQDDLWGALTAEAHRQGALPKDTSVKTVMDTWTLQKGYPLLTVSRDYDAGTVSITQARYQVYQVTDPRRSKDSSCWEVPLRYMTEFKPSVQSAWLHCSQEQQQQRGALSLDIGASGSGWILLNVNATGLFRVLYDERSWELLSLSLRQDPSSAAIDRLSRAQLVEDALALAWSGDLPYARALSLLAYLRRETDYLPWKAATVQLYTHYRVLRATNGYGPFQTFVGNLMKESLEKWGDFQRTLPEDDLEGFQHRGLLVTWACRLNVPSCLQSAMALFQRWMDHPKPDSNNPIPRGLVYEVTCAALKQGDSRQWEFAWQRYLATADASQRVKLLQALACARDAAILRRLLEWSAQEDKGIRRQDSGTVFMSVAASEYGFAIAKEFLYNNIVKLYKLFGAKADKLGSYVTALAGDLSSEQDLKEFNEFTTQSAEYLKKATLAVNQARDKISVNMAWYKKHYAEFVAQLEIVNSR